MPIFLYGTSMDDDIETGYVSDGGVDRVDRDAVCEKADSEEEDQLEDGCTVTGPTFEDATESDDTTASDGSIKTIIKTIIDCQCSVCVEMQATLEKYDVWEQQPALAVYLKNMGETEANE